MTDFDVVVMGSGAAGLTAALMASAEGKRVLLLERSPLYGGTTAISGGQVWVPNHHHLARQAGGDSPQAALDYLQAVTMDEVSPHLLEAFVDAAPRMISKIERLSALRFFQVERHDYHSEWRGAAFGRSLEPAPYDLSRLGTLAPLVRRSPHRPPLTSAELKKGAGAALIAERREQQLVTQGVALVAGLLEACVAHGVQLRNACRVTAWSAVDAAHQTVSYETDGRSVSIKTRCLVVASGGFEWNAALKQAFLHSPDEGAASPPWNEGDGLRIGLRAGAAVSNMTESWWSAAFTVPGEIYDGRPLVRNIVRELALPGSLLVNADGRRFVNEAASYNALGKGFQVFDAARNAYPNKKAWLVFDQRFKDAHAVASIPASTPAPEWFIRADTLHALAVKMGIDPAGLQATIARFNGFAKAGLDEDFARGVARHDRYHGDATAAHPNLGEVQVAPYYAVPIFLGNLGTKGGMRTSVDGQVIDMDGATIPGLFACGNAAASWMGPGYPGAGGSLGPIMTAAFLCGLAAAQASSADTNHF